MKTTTKTLFAVVTPFVLSLLLPTLCSADTLYFVDTSQASYSSSVKAIDLSGAGSATTIGSGLPYSTSGLSLDSGNNLYTADVGGNVLKVTPAGAVSTYASGLSFPWGTAVTPNGNVYSLDEYGIIDNVTGGVVNSLTALGSVVSSSLLSDGSNNLYALSWSGYNNNNLVKISPSGVANFIATVPGLFDFAMARDAGGNFWIVGDDQTDPFGTATVLESIYKVTPGGTVSTFLSGLSISPFTIAVDRNGNVYVDDAAQDGIDKISPSGVISTFATGLDGPASFLISPVPEPGSVILAGLGLLGLLGYAWRRRRSSANERACASFSPSGQPLIRGPSVVCLAALAAASALWAMPATAHGQMIVVGDHNLLPNTPGQMIPIVVLGGGPLVTEVDLIVQVADGGPMWGSPAGPSITADLLAPGSIFFLNNTGVIDPITGDPVPSAQENIDRAALYGTQSLWLETTNPGGPVPVGPGLLAFLTVDTTGFYSGTWSLSLDNNGVSNYSSIGTSFDYGLIPIFITNGSISVPEPSSFILAALALAGLLACSSCRFSRSFGLSPMRCAMTALMGNALAVLAFPVLALATTVYDSTSTAEPVAYGGVQHFPGDEEFHAFSFSPSLSVSLDDLSLVVAQGAYSPTTGSMLLAADNGGTPGLFLQSWSFAVPASPTLVTLHNYTADVDLLAHQTYWLVLYDPVPDSSIALPLTAATSQTQMYDLGGPLYLSYLGGTWLPLTYWSDAQFRIDGTPIPEPSSAVLAGLAVVALLGYAWRRRHSTARRSAVCAIDLGACRGGLQV